MHRPIKLAQPKLKIRAAAQSQLENPLKGPADPFDTTARAFVLHRSWASVTYRLWRSCRVLRSDPAQAAKTQRQHKCLHEHWKNCQDYPEAHTWESRAKKDIEEEEAVRALVAAEDDSYLAYDEACKVRQFILAGRLLQDG
ncbi:hypothetical protein EI94DRAFT_1705344 [Lactarius quietus]|nr:hypothetical protein EI94DRAFT_1705344 [Lactarius quietus]